MLKPSLLFIKHPLYSGNLIKETTLKDLKNKISTCSKGTCWEFTWDYSSSSALRIKRLQSHMGSDAQLTRRTTNHSYGRGCMLMAEKYQDERAHSWSSPIAEKGRQHERLFRVLKVLQGK